MPKLDKPTLKMIIFDNLKVLKIYNIDNSCLFNLQVRPIMVPRDVQILPWFTGYAEAINAGKSVRNEDQAAFHRGIFFYLSFINYKVEEGVGAI